MINIKLAQEIHYQEIWQIFHHIVKTGGTYIYDPNTTNLKSYDFNIDFAFYGNISH